MLERSTNIESSEELEDRSETLNAYEEHDDDEDFEDFGPSVELEVIKVKNDEVITTPTPVATEIPLTIIANDIELVTMMCMPSELEEFTYGFLFTSGFINHAKEVVSYSCSETRWQVNVTLSKKPDLEMAGKRVYTSGCGKGVMYSNAIALASRRPLDDGFKVGKESIFQMVRWLLSSSELFKSTGCVHTAALSENGELPTIALDDIGRHNAVDKVIGQALMEERDFSKMILAGSGRISSEILLKTRRCGIPIIVSRAAPTHQAVLLARDMNLTVVGFVRGHAFTVYSQSDRIDLS